METMLLSDEARELRDKVGDVTAFLKKLSNPDRLLLVCALVDGERSVRSRPGSVSASPACRSSSPNCARLD